MSEPNSEGFRSPKVMVATIFLAAVVVVGAVTLVLAGRGSGADPPPSNEAEPAPPAELPDSAGTSKCGLEPGPQAIPEATPDQTQWDLLNGFAAPRIDGVGPGLEEDDGLRHCYAHSPTGALLAIANYLAMGAVDPIHMLDPRVVVETPDVIERREGMESGELTQEPLRGELQIAGFRVLSASPEAVTADLVVRGRNGGYYAQLFEAQWRDGTWLVVFHTDEDVDYRAVDSMTDYVTWRGI